MSGLPVAYESSICTSMGSPEPFCSLFLLEFWWWCAAIVPALRSRLSCATSSCWLKIKEIRTLPSSGTHVPCIVYGKTYFLCRACPRLLPSRGGSDCVAPGKFESLELTATSQFLLASIVAGLSPSRVSQQPAVRHPRVVDCCQDCRHSGCGSSLSRGVNSFHI